MMNVERLRCDFSTKGIVENSWELAVPGEALEMSVLVGNVYQLIITYWI